VTGRPQPIFPYPGAKWMLAPRLIRYFPDHRVYLEPYFGSGAVYFTKGAAPLEILNDQSGEVMHTFTMIRDRTAELAWALHMTPYSRDELTTIQQAAPTDDPIERARRFLALCGQAYGGQPGQGWNTPRPKHDQGRDEWYNRAITWNSVPKRMRLAAERLRRAHIENGPALDVIRRYADYDVLLYCDPPYLMESRADQSDLYTHEMTTADHAALLDALLTYPGMVALSGYMSDLYSRTLRGWRCLRFNGRAVSNTDRDEYLWLNPLATAGWSNAVR
jgi:DNA adenine methylase